MKPVAALMVFSLLNGCASLPSFVASDEPAPLKLAALQSFTTESPPWRFAFDPSGDAWFLNEDYLIKASPTGDVRVTLGNTTITGFGIDSRGNCWVGNQANRLTKYAPDGREIWRKQYHFGDWTHLPVAVRPDDSLWINAEGLEKLDANGESLGKVDVSGLKDVYFREIIETPSGEVWLAGDGLGKLDADGRPLGSFLPGSAIQAVVADREGNLWIANALPEPGRQKGWPIWHEVMKISPRGEVAITLMRETGSFGLATDRQNNLWLLHTPDDRTELPTLEKFSSQGRSLGKVKFDKPVSGMAIDPAGFLWVGETVGETRPRGHVTKYAIE
jgi:ligand-binding sensor domain-containing protein